MAKKLTIITETKPEDVATFFSAFKWQNENNYVDPIEFLDSLNVDPGYSIGDSDLDSCPKLNWTHTEGDSIKYNFSCTDSTPVQFKDPESELYAERKEYNQINGITTEITTVDCDDDWNPIA